MNGEEETVLNNRRSGGSADDDDDERSRHSESGKVEPATEMTMMMEGKQSTSNNFVVEDPQSFLSEGNKHFIHKRFTSAIAAYSEGLKLCLEKDEEEEVEDVVESEPNSVPDDRRGRENKSYSGNVVVGNWRDRSSCLLDLYCNRALAYLSIENYEATLEDTEQVLLRERLHIKGVIRKAKALAGLRRFKEAIEFVEEGIKEGKEVKKEVKELETYLEKLKWMKHQSETGDYYDVPFIMTTPYEPAPPDWVDYVGAVKVENIPGKGRGLVATQDLPPAKLVLAARAFEIIYLDGKEGPEEGLSEESKRALESGEFKVEDDKSLNLLARKVYDRLKRNPERRADFYQLFAGNDLGYIDPPPKSDLKNSPPPLDMARIYGICRTNTFANSGDTYPEVEKSVGIWLLPAFVNHQCIGGNCTWKIFGDFNFVRTFKPVKKGEELVHSYVSPAYPYGARTDVLTNRLGFVCECILCDLDRSLPPSVHEEKTKLRLFVQKQEVKFAQLDMTQNGVDYSKRMEASVLLLEQIIQKLEKIQPKHGQHNASLLDPLQKLGLKYFGIGNFQSSTKIMEKAYALMKSCMMPHGAADCSLWIIAAYLQMGNGKLAKKWGKNLKGLCSV